MLSAKNIVSAFSEYQVERLTGLTVHQLRYWDRTGFFGPSFAAENRRVAFSRVYSFKDVVSLRVLNSLRNQFRVSLPHLRQVKEKLAHLEDDMWTKTALFVVDRKVVFKETTDAQPREIVSGQYIFGIALHIVVSDTERDVAEFRKRPAEKIGVVERNRLVAHNAWVIAGTRIPVATIKRFHEAGYSADAIIREYPDLTEQDVKAAIAHNEKAAAA